MTTQDDSLFERVEELLPSLAATAANLNKASKDLSALIGHIERVLQRLNLGVPAWTVVTQGGPAVEGTGPQYWFEDLGYGRIGRKSWGLILRKREGDESIPDSEHYDEWPFNEAPREFRIRAVKHIPNLLKELDQASQEMLKKLSKSIQEIVDVAVALDETVSPQQRPIKGKSGRRS